MAGAEPARPRQQNELSGLTLLADLVKWAERTCVDGPPSQSGHSSSGAVALRIAASHDRGLERLSVADVATAQQEVVLAIHFIDLGAGQVVPGHEGSAMPDVVVRRSRLPRAAGAIHTLDDPNRRRSRRITPARSVSPPPSRG